jgi:hypothetical protein
VFELCNLFWRKEEGRMSQIEFYEELKENL